MTTPSSQLPSQHQQEINQQQQQQQQAPKTTTTEAKAAFTTTLISISASQNLDKELIDRTRSLHANSSAIENQESDLRRTTADLARGNEELIKEVDVGWEGLKEVGDVQNWAEVIERDLLIVGETLRLVDEGGGGGGDDDGERSRYADQDHHDHNSNTDKKGKGKDKRVSSSVSSSSSSSWLKWW